MAPPSVCTIEGATNVVLSTVPRRDESLASHIGVIFMQTVVRIVLAALARPVARSGAPSGPSLVAVAPIYGVIAYGAFQRRSRPQPGLTPHRPLATIRARRDFQRVSHPTILSTTEEDSMRFSLWTSAGALVVLSAASCTPSENKTRRARAQRRPPPPQPHPRPRSPPPRLRPREDAAEEGDEILMVWAEAEPDEGAPPLEVQLKADVSGGVGERKVKWEFGDGSPASTRSIPSTTTRRRARSVHRSRSRTRAAIRTPTTSTSRSAASGTHVAGRAPSGAGGSRTSCPRA